MEVKEWAPCTPLRRRQKPNLARKTNCLRNNGDKNVLLKCLNHEEFQDKCTTPSCASFTSLTEISAGNHPNYPKKMIKMMARISLRKCRTNFVPKLILKDIN